MKGLLYHKTFQVVDKSSVPKGTRIFGLRWVDALKTVDGVTMEKSRIVARNFKDKDALRVSTRSPTATRLGLGTSACLSTIFSQHQPYLRDISQAYVQSKQNLSRKIILHPLPEMKFPNGKVLFALKPLYGIPEAGLYWFVTYSQHHLNELGMKSTSFDACILYRRNNKTVEGITILQVDDSFGFGSSEFLEKESKTKESST